VTARFGTGPDAPFIASRRAEHDGSRRVLATGRTRGGSPLVQVCARFGDLQATGTREAAGIARVAASGRRAWDLHKAAGETES
jgi:hypothetical protein